MPDAISYLASLNIDRNGKIEELEAYAESIGPHPIPRAEIPSLEILAQISYRNFVLRQLKCAARKMIPQL